MYIAHKTDGGAIQTVLEHSKDVADLAEQFCVAPLKTVCGCMGWLHDAGKYQKTFQDRINGKNVRIEHSICGARLCQSKYGNTPLGLLIELCVAGHHTGIPDCGTLGDTANESTLYGRLKRTGESIDGFFRETSLPGLDPDAFTRFLVSDCKSRARGFPPIPKETGMTIFCEPFPPISDQLYKMALSRRSGKAKSTTAARSKISAYQYKPQGGRAPYGACELKSRYQQENCS